jgi:hypothetical protein
MFTNNNSHRTIAAAGFVCLTTILLAPVPAHASRLPADPLTFVGTPTVLSRVVNDAHAANVRAALDDLRADHAGLPA